MTRETYEKLLKFGDQGSFTLWEKENPEDEKAGLSDMTLFKDENLLARLKSNLVFVSMNLSKEVERQDGYKGPWWNFHSELGGNTDVKLRSAFQAAKFNGYYITDLIKDYPETNSQKLVEMVRDHPEVLDRNMEILLDELSCFEEKPVVVALGSWVYDKLRAKKRLGKDYTVLKLNHFSNWAVGKDEYTKLVLDFAKSLNLED